jgi:hypothetical protein
VSSVSVITEWRISVWMAFGLAPPIAAQAPRV